MKITLFFIMVFLSVTILFAQWSGDSQMNLAINNNTGEQALPKIAYAQNSNVFIGFFSNENSNYNVRLQLLDSAGNPLWQEGGILVSNHQQMSWLTDWDMDVDNAGNAIIVFQDIRENENNNVVAYCISQQGEFIWGEDGIMLSHGSSFDVSPKVAVTGSGNIIVAWQSDDVVRIQKISPDGDLLFGETGLTIQEENITFSWPQIITFEDDSFILKYFRDSGPAWAPIREVYASKYNSNGEIVWNTPITIAGGISAWTQILSIEKDEENGFYIAWYEDRDQDNKFEIYIQHLNANGEITFAENGMEICTNTTQNHFQPSLQVFGSYVIAAWEETDANQNQRGLFAQKISADGTLLWGENGLVIIPLSNENLSFISNKKIENNFVVYYSTNPSGTVRHIFAMALDENGQTVWNNPITTISDYDSDKIHVTVSPFLDNQSVIAWQDTRNDSGDIYAQNLMANGSIGQNGEEIILEYFTADVVNENILITWGTLNEENLAGWNIYRAESENFDNSQKINNEIIPAYNQNSGNDYTFTDSDNLVNGVTYYYWLEAVWIDDNTEIFGSISVIYNSVNAQNDNVDMLRYKLTNYPNPFNPTTTISYQLPEQSDVELSIYNLKGEKIITLDKGTKEKGKYSVVWNGLDKNGKKVPSGVYFYRIKAGKFTAAKKMILLK